MDLDENADVEEREDSDEPSSESHEDNEEVSGADEEFYDVLDILDGRAGVDEELDDGPGKGKSGAAEKEAKVSTRGTYGESANEESGDEDEQSSEG